MWPLNCSFWAKEVCTNFRGVYCVGDDEAEWESLKLVIFHSTHFADIVRCVAFCIIIINGFLMTQRQMTLKDVGV